MADDIIIRHVSLTNLANTPAVGSTGLMVDTPRGKLRDALCVPIFFAKDLGLALAPKMCPDQSQAFKDVNNSQAFTLSRCSLARHVCKTFSADIRRTDCVRQKHEVIFSAQIESALKQSNYDSKP